MNEVRRRQKKVEKEKTGMELEEDLKCKEFI
jgi:hypothetical protein